MCSPTSVYVLLLPSTAVQCFCADSLKTNYELFERTSTDCDMACSGDSSENCGGNTIMSVYHVQDASIIGEKYQIIS